MLHDQDIAGHQLRASDAGELVGGEVPGLDAKQHADGEAFHVRFSAHGTQWGRCQEGLGVLRVIAQDLCAEIDLTARLVNALAHLQSLQLGEVVDMGVQQLCRLCQDGGTLDVGLVLPGLEAAFCRRQRAVELAIAHVWEAFEFLAIIGVDTLVGHAGVPLDGGARFTPPGSDSLCSPWRRARRRWPHPGH
jgi:hypothetical protein